MGYNKKMKKASVNHNCNCNCNCKSKCSVNDVEEILDNFEGVEEETQEEIMDVIELLQYAVDELDNLMRLNTEQSEIDDQIDKWKEDCIREYDVSWSTCKCDETKNQYNVYNEKVEDLIEETMVLVEEALKNVMTAKSLFSKKIDVYNHIKSNCYLELDDRSCGCGKGYTRNYEDEDSYK